MDESWRPSSSKSEKTSIVDYGEEIAEANGDYKLEKEKDEVVPERSSSCRFYLRKEGKHYDACSGSLKESRSKMNSRTKHKTPDLH